MDSNGDLDLSSPDVRLHLRHLIQPRYPRAEFANVFQFKFELGDVEWPRCHGRYAVTIPARWRDLMQKYELLNR